MVLFTNAVAALVAASLAAAVTPEGFEPQVDAALMVIYGDTPGEDGAALEKSQTQSKPMLATSKQMSGTYAVAMVDIDVPTSNSSPPQTSTFLHWLQTGLTSSTSATTFALADGSAAEGFMLSNAADATALADYLGPSPPPGRQPLQHRYTLLLVDHSGISDKGLTALSDAAGSRRGFDVAGTLDSAGLTDKAVAGNFFTVGAVTGNSTNDGAATGTAGGTGGLAPTATDGSPAATSALVSGAGRMRLEMGIAGCMLGMLAWTWCS